MTTKRVPESSLLLKTQKQNKMTVEILTKEMREELLATYADYLPDEELVVVTFNNENENYFERIMRSMHCDKDYAISYWNEHNEECGLCLTAMNELDAEDKFNGEFPGNIFISAKEIQI